MSTRGQGAGLDLGRFALLAAPFYLNDLANMHVHDWRMWLALDYAFAKAWPIGLIAVWIARGRLARGPLGLAVPGVTAAAATLVIAAVAGALLDQNGYAVLAPLPGYPELGAIPFITAPAVRWFDLTVGLVLVGVAEEAVFRAVLADALERRGLGPVAIVAVSAVAFGLIHWSAGAHAVLVTGVIGAVFMVVFLRWRCLPALALGHALVDFVAFAGVIPTAWFRLA